MLCKYCGEKISRKDRICPNCKKQLKTGISIKEKLTAFWGQGSKKKTIIMTSIIGVLIVALAVESVFLGQAQSDITGLQEQVSSVTKQKETQYDSLTSTIASLRDDVTSEQSRASYYFEQYISAKDGYDFLMDHIVLVTEDGSKYHKYNCRYVKGKTFWAFNSEAAKGKGYTPCSICFGN